MVPESPHAEKGFVYSIQVPAGARSQDRPKVSRITEGIYDLGRAFVVEDDWTDQPTPVHSGSVLGWAESPSLSTRRRT